MKLLGKRQKLGNQGLSLIELLCSMAILGMLAMVVSSVLVVSAHSYRRENADTDAQQEAQLVANQITDLLIDASAHGGLDQVDYVFDSDTGTLTITQGAKGYEITHVVSEQKLYYSEYELENGVKKNVKPRQLMAENVKEFSVDKDDFLETGNIGIKMVYTKGTGEYPAAFNVTARNKELEPGTVAEVVLKVPTEIIQEPSQDFYKINARIVGGSGTLSYACEGNTDLAGTKVKPDGTVVIGDKETANMFRVRVTATLPNGTTEEKFVRVYVRRATGVSVTGIQTAGTRGLQNSVYKLTAVVDGNNMNKAIGTDYDDPGDPTDPNCYVNPYDVKWSVSGIPSDAYSLVWYDLGVESERYAELKLLRDLANGEVVTVTAKAAHPMGTNKSGKDYFPGAEGYWTLSQFVSMFTPGDGWMRQTDKAQATVDGDKLRQVKPGDGRHTFQVRFRRYPDGVWEEYGDLPGGWLTNKYGGDADDSMSVNMRPLLTGALDYAKDYEMQIRMTIYDGAGNKVWPTDSTPENEYLISGIVYRVGVIFQGIHLGFAEGTTSVSEENAPTVKMVRDQGYDMMKMTGIQGIEAERIENNLEFILEKKKATGEWDRVLQNVEVQNAQGTFKLTFRNSDDFDGQYRVKVMARNMPHYVLEGTNLVNRGNIDWILFDESNGHNIFYFNVMK